jgi:hypothetical protein
VPRWIFGVLIFVIPVWVSEAVQARPVFTSRYAPLSAKSSHSCYAGIVLVCDSPDNIQGCIVCLIEQASTKCHAEGAVAFKLEFGVNTRPEIYWYQFFFGSLRHIRAPQWITISSEEYLAPPQCYICMSAPDIYDGKASLNDLCGGHQWVGRIIQANLSDANARAYHFCSHSCLSVGRGAGCLCSFVGGVGSDLGILYALAHQAQLPEEQCDLSASDESQQQGEPGQRPRRGRQPPFVRRMFICAALFFIDICLALWGGENLYRKRYLIGAALIGAGGLLACAGLGLLWVTQFPGTWGWLL